MKGIPMSNSLNGDIICPPKPPEGGVIRVERVWQHRHDLEIPLPKLGYNLTALLMLGAGGLMLGAICMFASGDQGQKHNPSLKEATASDSAGREAVVSTKLQDIVDTASAPMSASVTDTPTASIPYTAVPTKRPSFERVKSGSSDKVNRVVSNTTLAEVRRYDQCSPSCETRDPLIVSTTPPRNSELSSDILTETTDLERSNQAVEIGTAALNGAGFVLVQTAALPFTALKLGRDAVTDVSQAYLASDSPDRHVSVDRSR